MKRDYVALACLAITTAVAVLVVLLRPYTFAVLEPMGHIALSERALIVHALLLMLIVVVPVFALAFAIAWRYRAGNTSAVYTPEWEHSKLEEFVWWIVPFEIILVLGALTWSSTHQLDPYKPLVSNVPQLRVEVVALEWKWLFIYPSLGIASVNALTLPVGTPVEFDITADAPMNSFWIPQLGGQIYAMTGMSTQLHVVANERGTYMGSSANYSGSGFASMTFPVTATSPEEFDAWVAQVKNDSPALTMSTYHTLAAPGTTTPATYAPVADTLYNSIIMQFMSPSTSHSGSDMGSMQMEH